MLLSVGPVNASRKGVSLLEITIVIVIIGILAAVALPNYTKMKEDSYSKEANLTLKLIQDAEQFYHIEHDTYVSGADIPTINSNLKLYIPNVTTNWNYIVTAATDSFTAKAKRSGYDNRTFCINQSSEDTYVCTW